MRIILNLLALLIIVAIAILASYNTNMVELKLWQNISYNINLFYIILFTLLSGLIAGTAIGGSYYLSSQNKLKEYKRKLEKNTVNAECESSKVDVLEAKIEVLEKALKSALEKND